MAADTIAPALTPTQVAIAAMRQRLAAAGYSATGPERLLLDAYEESEAEAADLAGRLNSAEAQLRTVDQRYGAVHEARDLWRTGAIDADDAMQRIHAALGTPAIPGKAAA